MNADDNLETRARRLENALQRVAQVHKQILVDGPAPTHKQVQATYEDVALLAGFIEDYLDDEFKPLHPVTERDGAFVDAFQKIAKAVGEIAGCLLAIGDEGPETTLIEKVTDRAANLREAFEQAVQAFIAVVNDQADQGLSRTVRENALQLAGDMTGRLFGRQLLYESVQVVDEAKQALDETERVLYDAKRAAGVIGATSYGFAYSADADKETHIADRLRWAVAALLVAITVYATVFAVVFDEVSLGNELLRLSVTIPLALLAGYLARESTRHRANARQAKDLAIALHTVSSYTDPLDEVGRDLRRVLGLRAFGAPAGHGAPVVGDGLYADLTALLERIETTLRGIRETTVDGQK